MNENTNFLDGFNGIGGIILILLFFIMFGNGGIGGWGNSNINSDFLYRDIQGVNTNVLTSACDTQKEVMQNRYDNALQTNTLQSQLAQCCCENKLLSAQNTSMLQAQMNANTQAILDKLCATEVQNLRDALAQEQRANLTNTLVSSNQIQTQNILGALLPTPKPSYIVASPYQTYYNGGCGFNNI